MGPTYKAASVREKHRDSMTWLTARREGLRENIDGETILNQVYDEVCSNSSLPLFNMHIMHYFCLQIVFFYLILSVYNL